MKKAYFLFLNLVTSFMVIAQTSSPDTYLFKEFTDGKVLMKNGTVENAPLNYDANSLGIVFKKDAQVMTLTGLETVDTIYIANEKFIPVEGLVYQVVSSAPVSLLSTYRIKNRPLTTTSDHGGVSKQSTNHVNNTLSDVYVNKRYQPSFTTELIAVYWLRKGDRLYKATTQKQIINVFANKNAQIDQFMKDNKTDLNKPDDVVKLVAYCNGL